MYYVICNGLVIELHEEEEHISISNPPILTHFGLTCMLWLSRKALEWMMRC